MSRVRSGKQAASGWCGPDYRRPEPVALRLADGGTRRCGGIVTRLDCSELIGQHGARASRGVVNEGADSAGSIVGTGGVAMQGVESERAALSPRLLDEGLA